MLFSALALVLDVYGCKMLIACRVTNQFLTVAIMTTLVALVPVVLLILE